MGLADLAGSVACGDLLCWCSSHAVHPIAGDDHIAGSRLRLAERFRNHNPEQECQPRGEFRLRTLRCQHDGFHNNSPICRAKTSGCFACLLRLQDAQVN